MNAVPSPNTVAARFVLGIAATERIPWWAAQWLADGHDGPALRELAGLDGRDPHAVNDLVPAAMAEMGVDVPTTTAAATGEEFRHAAELHLSGQASARWVAQQVEQIVPRADYSDDVLDLPLGRLYGIEDEWEGGWGRTVEELSAEIHAKCVDQLLGANAPPRRETMHATSDASEPGAGTDGPTADRRRQG